MAAEFERHKAEIDQILKPYQDDRIDKQSVAFVLLGCFTLDWEGLNITAKNGYRFAPPETSEGDHYIPWAEQRVEGSLKGIYWGSHNTGTGNATFTTFGDHFSLPRFGIPDALWQVRWDITQTTPESLKETILQLRRFTDDKLYESIARILFALREGPKTSGELASLLSVSEGNMNRILSFLEELQYVQAESGKYHAIIPVFTANDSRVVDSLLKLGTGIIENWLRSNYKPVEAQLAELTPVRNGVPYSQVFNQVWHYIFGLTNKKLVERGLFADPYSATRKYKGFIPAVWATAIYKD